MSAPTKLRSNPSASPSDQLLVAEWVVRAALKSYTSLEEHIELMTLADCEAALRLEAASKRRKALLRRLLQRAARLNELAYINQWKKELRWTQATESPVKS